MKKIEELLVNEGKTIFSKFLETNARNMPLKNAAEKAEDNITIVQPDTQIIFRQLKGRAGVTDFDITEELGGGDETLDQFMDQAKAESEAKVHQLTGFSDAIYAEAFVEVHHYNILLNIILINRTNKTIPNVTIELLTQGKLKIVDKPISQTLRSYATAKVKASLKVTSTDNGAIYGYLSYDSASGNIPNIINFSDIQIDFINAFSPSDCSELDFKKKWAEYEWENKVQVSTA